MSLRLNWIKCDGNQWCGLLTVNLDDQHFDDMEGVYVIWHGGQDSPVVRIGQGIIRERLATHRDDREILVYQQNVLYVTWAKVSESYRDGVERYLSDIYNPLIGSRFPNVYLS